MGGSTDNQAADDPTAASAPADRSDTTAKNLVVPLPEFLQEIHATLQRAEQAYARGDLDQTVRCAEEGLIILRLPLPRSSKAPVPPQYELFFRCFQNHEVYRTALALYKQGLLQLRRPGAEAAARQAWRRAWDLLEGPFANLDERLALTAGTTDFPVAGRVLRGLLRLRQKLREHLLG